MQRAALIGLIVIYSLSTFGIGVKGFYCCGKLTSVSLALVHSTEQTCSKKGDQKDDCCKTTYQFFKVKDNHLLADNAVHVGNIALDALCSYGFHSLAVSSMQEINVINGSHAPPIYKNIPLYLFNCIFRI